MGIMVSVAMALYLLQLDAGAGLGLAIATVGFWFGYLLLIISDSLDSGPIDRRRYTSQAFNLFGMMIIVFAFLGGAVYCILVVPFILWGPRF